MMYSAMVMDHYDHPRNVGSFEPGEENVGTGLVGSPECGDTMKLQLKITDDGIIEDVKFKTFGCGSAIASASYATELIKGRTVDEALGVANTDIVSKLELPVVKVHCSVLAENAIRAAIKDWRDRKARTSEAAATPLEA